MTIECVTPECRAGLATDSCHDSVYEWQGYSKSGHQALEDNIKRYEDAVKLLSSHRDAHPPVDPSRM